jgi:hypothetical protein
MISLFQTASGSWHIPSILMAASWLIGTLVAGGFMLANLRVNRDDRMTAFHAQEQAAIKIAKLEERQTPRTISESQRTRFIEALKAAPKGKVSVWSFMNADPGTIQYANQVRDMVVAAGFDSGIMVGMSMGGGPIPVGSGIAVRAETNQPPFAGAVQRAFADVDIPLQGVVDHKVPSDEVRVIIGLKPE